VLAAVREFCDTRVVPVANDYWERAEFPFELLDGYRDLGVAGGALCESAAPGCPRWAKG
jgi:glutaryl-CoA dehydrogenase